LRIQRMTRHQVKWRSRWNTRLDAACLK
jgi:hypothetical protein